MTTNASSRAICTIGVAGVAQIGRRTIACAGLAAAIACDRPAPATEARRPAAQDTVPPDMPASALAQADDTLASIPVIDSGEPHDTSAAARMRDDVEPKRVQRTPEGRYLEPVAFDTVWRRGITEDDTLVLAPRSIVADDTTVYYFDAAAYRIVALRGANGDLMWTFGRKGAGPGEFTTNVVLDLAPNGDIVALDRERRRVVRVTADGKMRSTSPIRTSSTPLSVCAKADGKYWATTTRSTALLVELSPDGDSVGAVPRPWAELADLPTLSAQATAQSVGGGCVVTMNLGHGFAIVYEEHPPRSARYVEDVTIARANVRRSPNGGMSQSLPDNVRYAAMGGGITADGLFGMLFVGRSAERNRVIDFYRMDDARYRHSWVLPGRTPAVAGSAVTIFVLDRQSLFPGVVALRPTRRGQER